MRVPLKLLQLNCAPVDKPSVTRERRRGRRGRDVRQEREGGEEGRRGRRGGDAGVVREGKRRREKDSRHAVNTHGNREERLRVHCLCTRYVCVVLNKSCISRC